MPITPPNIVPEHQPNHHKGWYYAGSAPHRDMPHSLQFLTFRLADSLPQRLLRELEREASRLAEPQRTSFKRRRLEEWLDAGYGCCALSRPEMAEVVVTTLRYHHGKRYRLIAWCIMPNHLHVLIEQHYSLPRIVQTWKSMTTRWMLLNNGPLALGVPGRSLWMRDYWDRYIRDEKHFDAAVHYIHENPVKAGLCGSADQWRWSSAWKTQA